ncbi:MAG TPA: cytochrome P450 [Acidimicrobiia bacterium]|jgi:cytochrome P450
MTYGTSTEPTPPAESGDGDLLDPVTALWMPDTATDPRETYRRLRQECPVASGGDMMGNGSTGWIVSRYDDVMSALRNPEVFSSGPDAVSIGQEQRLIPLQVDPPEHVKYRRLLDPEFSPKNMAALEPDVRALIGSLVDAFVQHKTCDFHEEVATPLPSTVFLRLMGMSQDDLPTLLQWRDNTIRPQVEPGDFDGAERIRAETGKEITKYFREAIAAKRANPDGALLSRIVHGKVDGRLPTDEELLGMCHLLLLAGLDTVTATLDCMIAWLAQHPERRRQLVEHPELIDNAVEELLRHETPVMMVARAVAKDIEFGGCQMRKGDSLTPLIGAANLDEGEFDDPLDVSWERTENRHMAFGAGPHRCLGSHLARLELRVAIEEFHKRIPDYSIAEGAVLSYSPGIRQADALPLVW